MRKRSPILFTLLILSSLIASGALINVHAAFGCQTAPGNTCNFEADSHIPASDGTVQVSITGGTYNGMCPASCFNLNHTWALVNSTEYTVKVLNPLIIGAASGQRYAFKEWDYVGQYFDGSPSNPVMLTPPMYTNYTTAQCHNSGSSWLNCPFTAVFTVSPPLGCKTNCNLDALTNVPFSDGTIKVQVDGGTIYSLGATLSFPNGTVHNIQVLNSTFTGPSSRAKYTWKQWDCTCGVSPTSSQTLTTPTMYYNYTVSQSGAFTARFDKQYPLTLTFKDQSGNTLSPPTSLQLVNGGMVVNVTSYSGTYESALVWNVRNVAWEGVSGIEAPGQTVDLTSGAASGTVVLEAYPAAVKVVDNSNNPVSGANVTVSFFNSTRRAFQTNSQGLVQLGDVPCYPSGNSFVCTTFSANVTYRGTSASSGSVDISNPQNNPYSIPINVGSSPVTTPLVSAIVLLTIFGLATFLILLAVKVRKPPPAPIIDTGTP